MYGEEKRSSCDGHGKEADEEDLSGAAGRDRQESGGRPMERPRRETAGIKPEIYRSWPWTTAKVCLRS
jgi:hypothetical protein